MWLIKSNINKSKSIKLKWLLKLYYVVKNLKLINTSGAVIHTNNSFNLKPINTTSFINNSVRLVDSKSFTSFKVFTSLGSNTTNGLLDIHPTNRGLFLKSSSGTGSYTSIKLHYHVYKSFETLVYNLLYFNINLISFGNSVFKQEISALNWNNLELYLSVFKLNFLSIFFQPNKLNDKFPRIFSFLKLNGFHTALVYDSNYHKRTIYYLQRLNFFSIGIIPANMPKYTLNVSLPTLNDNLLMHLFMVKRVIKIKRSVSYNIYKEFYTAWQNKKTN